MRVLLVVAVLAALVALYVLVTYLLLRAGRLTSRTATAMCAGAFAFAAIVVAYLLSL